MAGYDFTFNMSLQAPANADVNKVRKTIEAGLKGIKIDLDTKGMRNARAEVDRVGRSAKNAAVGANDFADSITMKGRSFAAYAVASSAIIRLTGAMSNATREALKLEKEIIKIAQTTGQSNRVMKNNSHIILNISREYGVASTKVAKLVRVLTQTGMAFREAAKGASILAKTELLASFENLEKTTEGLIVLMASFNQTTAQAGKGLEAINAVSKRFAVESSDIVEAIQKSGGAFKTAGGNVNELIALFTSVRSTSRESAETIGAAFKTIFGRLQRPKTVEFFKELNIELADAQGNFVGGYEAIKRITKGLKEAGISAGSIRFAEVVEQIGGIRQISKVVPLLTQFEKAQRALDVANRGTIESDKDVEKAKRSLSFQIAELTQNFRALFYEVTETEGFKAIAAIFLATANAAVELTRTLKPLIPYLALIGGFKLGRSLVRDFGAMRTTAMGGARGFARGGSVPGKGNRDTVPAMLTPGEFVIRKSSVEAFGAENLNSINKYANGRKVKPLKKKGQPLTVSIGERSMGQLSPTGRTGIAKGSTRTTVGKLKGLGKKLPPNVMTAPNNAAITVRGAVKNMVLGEESGGFAEDEIIKGGLQSIDKKIDSQLKKAYKSKKPIERKSKLATDKNAKQTVAGFALEQFAAGLGKVSNQGGQNAFDIIGSAGLENFTKTGSTPRYIEVKRTQQNASKIVKKGIREKRLNFKKYAKGGGVGTDTVPALLTPGEFVVNEKSAKAFGYGNLGRINKYAAGGVVQKFKDGGELKMQRKPIPTSEKGIKKAWGTGLTTRPDPNRAGMLKAEKQQKAATTKNIEATKNQTEATKNNSKETTSNTKSKTGNTKTQNKLTKSTGLLSGGLMGLAGKAFAAMFAFEIVTGLLEKSGATINNSALESRKGLLALQAGLLTAANTTGKWGKSLTAYGVNMQKSAQTAMRETARGAGTTMQTARQATGKGLKNLGKSIIKIGPKIAKVLNIIAGIDIAGMLVEGLFTTDLGKVKDAAIQAGDAQLAAASANRQYGQSVISTLPIIGDFAAAIDSWTGGALAFNIASATGMDKLLGPTAALQASMVKAGKTIERSSEAADKALREGNFQEFNKQIEEGFGKTAKDIGQAGDDLLKQTQNFKEFGATMEGAKVGGASGAVTGAALGLPFGAPGIAVGTLVGGAIGAVVGGLSGLATAGAAMTESAKQSSAAFEARAAIVAQGIAKISPAFDSVVANAIDGGSTMEEAFAIAMQKMGGAVKSLGMIVDEKEKKEKEDELKKLQAGEAEFGKERIAMAKRFWVWNRKAKGFILDSAETQNQSRQKELKSQLTAYDQSKDNATAAKAAYDQTQLLNKAYIEQVAIQKELVDEIFNLNERVRAAEFAGDEMKMSKSGNLTSSLALDRMGMRGVAEGKLGDITKRKEEKQFITTAGGMLGIGGARKAKKALTLQQGLDKITSDPEKFLPKKKTGQDSGQQASDFVDSLFGGVRPPNMQASLKVLEQKVEKAMEDGDYSDIAEVVEKELGDQIKNVIKPIQDGLKKVGGMMTQLQSAQIAHFDLEMKVAKLRLSTAKEHGDILIDIDRQRIEALASIGATAADVTDMEKQHMEKRRKNQKKQQRGREKEFGKRGSANYFITSTGRGATFTSEKAKETMKEANKLSGSTTPSDITKRAALEDKAFKQQAALDGGEIATRKEKIANMRMEIEGMKQEEQARRENTKSMQEARGALAEDLAFGTDEARASLLEDANVAATALSQGSMAGFTGEQRGQVDSFLGRFTGLGGRIGEQARAAKGQLGAQELLEQGLIRPDQFEQTAQDIARQEEPLNTTVARGIREGYAFIENQERKINAIKEGANKNEESYVDNFGEHVKKFGEKVDEIFLATAAKTTVDQLNAEDAEAAKNAKQAKKTKISKEQTANTAKIKTLQDKQEAKNKAKQKLEKANFDLVALEADIDDRPLKKPATGGRGSGYSSHELSMTSNKPDPRLQQRKDLKKQLIKAHELNEQTPSLSRDEKTELAAAKQRRAALDEAQKALDPTYKTANEREHDKIRSGPTQNKGSFDKLMAEKEKEKESEEKKRKELEDAKSKKLKKASDYQVKYRAEQAKKEQERIAIARKKAADEQQRRREFDASPMGAQINSEQKRSDRPIPSASNNNSAGLGNNGANALSVEHHVSPVAATINVPEIMNFSVDFVQGQVLAAVADAFKNYADELKGSDGSPGAAAAAADPSVTVPGLNMPTEMMA